MTLAAFVVGLAVHSRAALFFGLLVTCPFLFAASMAMIANRSLLLSRLLLALLVTGIAIVVLQFAFITIVTGG